MKGRRKSLTEATIAAASCPRNRAWQPLWDAGQPGLVVRVFPTGRKTYAFSYRPAGGGRAAPRRWVTLGDAAAMSLKDARDAARIMAGDVAKGADPAAERRQAKRRERACLEPALDDYESSLRDRHVVKRGEVLSLLRRELLTPLGNVDLAELDRQALVNRIKAVKDSGRPGAAKELRTRAGVFLGWAVDEGLIPANPLAGWRQPRRTRAQRLAQPGRALADAELPSFWRAAEAQRWPFGPYLQLLLLLGQRRTETVLMAWSDLVLNEGVTIWPDHPPITNVWIVPAAITKSGREHYVPLPRQAVMILSDLPRLNRCDAVFPGRKNKPMTGWSKRLPQVYAATEKEGLESWTLHDLRRTMRTGLGKLGIDDVVRELMLNHAISDDLARIYDRGDYWHLRVDAAQRWADHVFAQLEKKPASIVQLAEARQ